jgi:hypothetical protein
MKISTKIFYFFIIILFRMVVRAPCPWRAGPPLHLLDAVVAMRSESRAVPRAIATVIFSFYDFYSSSSKCLFSSAALPTGTLAPPFERRESTRKRMRVFARTAAMPNDRTVVPGYSSSSTSIIG